jgi:predicted RND superfamily exporter protein
MSYDIEEILKDKSEVEKAFEEISSLVTILNQVSHGVKPDKYNGRFFLKEEGENVTDKYISNCNNPKYIATAWRVRRQWKESYEKIKEIHTIHFK